MLANVAIPSFLPHSIATLIGLVIIAGIECLFLMRMAKLSFGSSYRLSLRANFNSTIIGIPVAWGLWMIGLIPISFLAAKLEVDLHPLVGEASRQSVLWGGIMPSQWNSLGMAVGSLVVLIPFFVGSIWIERRTLIRELPELEKAKVSRGVLYGNLASYAIFVILGLLPLKEAIEDYPADKKRFEERRAQQ